MNLPVFLPRSLYAANISANPEWWLRTLPSFHSLLDFLLWSSFVATHFLSRGDIVSHFAGFSKLGEQWRLVHAQTIIGFESFYSNFLALHLEDEIHLQTSPFLKIEDTAIGAHLVNEKLGLESLCHCSSSSCPQNFIISFVGAQSHIWLHFAAFKPTACGFVMLHTLVLNAPAMFRCSSKSQTEKLMLVDQPRALAFLPGEGSSFHSTWSRTAETTAFCSPAIFIVKTSDFCLAGMQRVRLLSLNRRCGKQTYCFWLKCFG